MFDLHETTRRGLCRMGFLFLCLLPACGILAISVWLGSDTHRLLHEQQLGDRLALEVSLEEVAFTRPEGVRYRGLKLADPETGATLATAKTLSIWQQEDAVYAAADGLEIHASRIDGFKELVTRQLRIGKSGEKIRASCETVKLILANKTELVVDDVRGQFDFVKEAAQGLVKFRPVGGRSDELVSVRLVRDRQTVPPSVGFEIATGKNPLPCKLLEPFVPAVARLGANCKFVGDVYANDTIEGWDAQLRGEFVEVELGSLVERNFPSQLSGEAKLNIEGARVVGGRIEWMHGTLACGDGFIHRDLAARLTKEFSLTGLKDGPTFGASHPFSELAFNFAIDAKGLLISGGCKSGPKGTVLIDRFGVAVGEPAPAARLPLETLENAFSESRATLVGLLPVEEKSNRR